MSTVKIGVVGCGRIGKLHIDNLINAVPGVEVVAVADPMIDKSGARDWCAARGITNVSTDYMDVVNNKDVDAVFVCSSTDTHSVISLAAVNAGKHVFCEKPVDYDVDKIKAVMAAVEEKGVNTRSSVTAASTITTRLLLTLLSPARSAIPISLSFLPVTLSRPRLPMLLFPAVSSTT